MNHLPILIFCENHLKGLSAAAVFGALRGLSRFKFVEFYSHIKHDRRRKECGFYIGYGSHIIEYSKLKLSDSFFNDRPLLQKKKQTGFSEK